MGVLIFILFFGGLLFLGALQAGLDKRKRRIRDAVTTEVLRGLDLAHIVEQYKRKLEYIGKIEHDMPVTLRNRLQLEKREGEEGLFGECNLCQEGHLRLIKTKSEKILICSNYPKCRNVKKYSLVKSNYKEIIQRRFLEDLREAYS